MASTQTSAIITMKILIEKYEITPVWVFLENLGTTILLLKFRLITCSYGTQSPKWANVFPVHSGHLYPAKVTGN